MPRVLKIIGVIALINVIVLVLLLVVAAIMPEPADPPIDMANHGAGSSSVEPSYSGLQRAWPASNEPADNPTTPEKAALGKLLFFDPLLSENNNMACATCHHPDLGFGDGQPVASGPDGPLTRNTPTLWNVDYVQKLFWDGRMDSLESQVNFPLTHPNEMGVSDIAALEAELRANPEYVALFDAAFGGGEQAVTTDNMARALAAFQRTLLSQNSQFDRYAAGNFDALTPQQRRGLALFRSGATRCFECHGAPTFASDTFRVVGVPSDDPGRAGVTPDGQQGAFKVPTLRNIALTAPYMHNGSLATLEDVVNFYADGGGHAFGVDNVDVFVNGFDLNDQERSDLVAFLYALTDEWSLPALPEAVPSGLPVVQRLENPARAQAFAINRGGGGETAAPHDPTTITVQNGESIQTAIDRAQPGDTVLIPYGTYHETVAVDISDLTIEGIPNEQGEWPVLDGEFKLADGFVASGNNFALGKLAVKNYNDNGVLVEGATGVHIYDMYAERTGTYGIYPVRSTNVLVERVEVTGVEDAGIYVGQSENAVVRDCMAHGNVAGIELENTLNGEVTNCHAYNNTAGVLVFVLPQLTSKISSNTRIHGNLIESNNLENFARGGVVSFVPPGIGVLLLGADNAEVYENVIKDNKTGGIGVYSLTRTGVFEPNELDVGPLPEGNQIYDNILVNNGYDPDTFLTDLGISGADIIWDGSGANNTFDQPGASSFPPILPKSSWPTFLHRAYDNILNFAVEQLM
ncbi:MAG: right-handed parallel beta-helix repeat-containing protein [Anaerolineales bacterium]|nr:right-handed parallel beta-helix repeat-containing protein [Anaerolineales bacterium]